MGTTSNKFNGISKDPNAPINWHGGFDAEKTGKKLVKTKRLEYFDFLNTKTGNIRRTFVKGKEGDK